MTMTSAAVPAVSFSATAPFVLPTDMSPAEQSHMRCRVDSLQETAKMLAAFEELWASGRYFSLIAGPFSALPLLLMTSPIADPSPVPPAVLLAVSVASASVSLACLDSPSCSADSLSQLRERSRSCRLHESRPVPVWSPGCQRFPVPLAIWFPGHQPVPAGPGLGCKGGGGLPRESSRRSRHLTSPSRRGTGSGCLGVSLQKEQSSQDLFSVMAALRSLNGCRRLL